MRKLLATLLFALLALPLAAPLLAMSTDADAGIPVCCRKSGKHRCMMVMFHEQGKSGVPEIGAPEAKCPFAPSSVVSPHIDFTYLSHAGISTEITVTFAEGLRQTESKWRIARDRSRLKRGPPSQQIA